MVHCLARNVFYCTLGPNDLESHVPLYKYVDDSTLFDICNTTDVSVMQESIDRAVDWTNNNCMKINSKESKEMVICFTPYEHFRNSIPSIAIAGVGTYDSLCTNFNYYQLFRDFHFFGGCRASGYV